MADWRANILRLALLPPCLLPQVLILRLFHAQLCDLIDYQNLVPPLASAQNSSAKQPFRRASPSREMLAAGRWEIRRPLCRWVSTLQPELEVRRRLRRVPPASSRLPPAAAALCSPASVRYAPVCPLCRSIPTNMVFKHLFAQH